MSTLTLVALDISCEHCQRRITEAEDRLDGVRSVAVDIEAKTVPVDLDDAVVSKAEVRRVLDEAGYPTEP
jgi:copper chaperone CopZ